MSRIYYVIAYPQNGFPVSLGWSEKIKWAEKYWKESLGNSHCVEIVEETNSDILSKIDDGFSDINEMEEVMKKRLVKCHGIVLSELEWGILEDDFSQYRRSLIQSFKKVCGLYNILTEKGQSGFRNFIDDFRNLSDDAIFKNYIYTTPFIAKDDKQDTLVQRLILIESYKESDQMDQEYREICNPRAFEIAQHKDNR